MALVRWDPGRDLDSLQGDVNRLFDSFFGRRDAVAAGSGARRWVPAMDLVETEDDLVLRADLPGVEKDDIKVEVKDRVLTIAGERRAQHEDKHEGYHRVERSYGSFARSFELPRGVGPETVRADYENGVLEVRIPKPTERQPVQVAVGDGERSRTIEHGEAEEREPAAAAATE